ncbi:MAG TPA: RNA polymerase sigma factor [Gammaproteobacteria bacterium]|nr:RNA polymerase sigma factor [Gammaproteobacteria bacterium]
MSKQGNKESAAVVREAMLEALPRLRRFARSLTGNRHDADDLLHDTVERVLDRGVPQQVDVGRWMFKVCKNLWIDELRAHSVRVKAAAAPELAEEPAVSGESVAFGELELREVDRALALLPDEQRLVLALVAVEGLTYREAAEVLDVPLGTVMSRLARARAALVARLEATVAEPSDE